MLLTIITWIILLFRPSFIFLFALGIAMIVFSLPGFFAAQSREEIIVLAISLAIGWSILFLGGALIIVVRKWMQARSSRAERDADREIERIRAEAAARDNQPPT